MTKPDLEKAWADLWLRLEACGDAKTVFGDLVSRYSERGRAYHTLAHLEDCLIELTNVPSSAASLDAIEFALWFHDAVYDTKAKDNEEQSAALASEVVRSASLSDAFGDLVTRLILATKHAAPPAAKDEQLLVDVDLSILGQDRAKFDEYERQIRVEYSWVPPDAFAEGRAAILASLLKRQRLYSTEFFYRKYETAARENLARSIAHLSASADP